MPKIRVALRVRPLSQREAEENYPVVVAVENNAAFITDIRVPERPSADSRPRYRQFHFDHTFWFSPSSSSSSDNNGRCHYSSSRCPTATANKNNAISASQAEVYKEMGPYLEKAILAGYNACLLAYGQSGSGKTHTMIGSRDDPGIIPRLCRSLWDKLGETYPPQPESPDKPGFRMEVSFLEIYREKVRDLLNPDKVLKLREHPQLGPHVQGLTRLEVNGETSLLDLLWEGEGRRALGNTRSNRRSSRSHAIWTLYLTVFNTKKATAVAVAANQVNSGSTSDCSSIVSGTSHNASRRNNYRGSRRNSNSPEKSDGDDSTGKIITNQVHLVDLAGSEKADCTTAKTLLAEGADINRSLVALGNVISALAEKAQYIPYRDSALTWLLKDSIGGNASTSIIITASPSSHCHEQTLNSLRFAQRARLVENTPKINLAPASSSSTTHYGPYGFLSVMQAMELKNEISRLAKIIKTAENNGGILRGLAPRAGWTRLIHAIEGIGHAEKEQVRLQRERAFSEDTTASSSQSQAGGTTTLTSSSSSSTPTAVGGGVGEASSSINSSSSSATITATKSFNDVMVQADMEKRKHLLLKNLKRRPSCQSESALPQVVTTPSSLSSPSKIVGTEVFIPTSNSYKCLTWQQEEAQPVPKPLADSASSSEECVVDDHGSTNDLQIHHLKYLLEVHYPISHNIDHASRISERIHGNIVDENYQNKTELIPVEVDEDPGMESNKKAPLVHNKVPTLVNPHDLDEEDTLSDQIDDFEPPKKPETVLVTQTAKESKDYLFPMKCKEFASALPLTMTAFEDSDENEFAEAEETPVAYPDHVYRAIHPKISKSLEKTLSSEHPSCSFDEHCYYTACECSLDQIPTMVISSSSSYESINMPDTVRPVHLIQEFSETNDICEDDLEDFTVDNEVFSEEYQAPVANVCMVPGQPMETAVPIEILVAEPNCLDNAPSFNPINGVSDSKFRNYFAKELHQMERMGKQIKTLLQMTQRFNVVKPYLDEISNLQNSDHSRPDPILDAHIDSCSGWNVDIELTKVNNEIRQLNKVLKTGLGTEGMANANPASADSNGVSVTTNNGKQKQHDLHPTTTGKIPTKNIIASSTSTIHNDTGGLTSDESSNDIDTEGYFQASFAHTRQIPMLSRQASSSSSSNDKSNSSSERFHYNFSHPPQHPFRPAKGSISQPMLSSNSSNNDSFASISGTSGSQQQSQGDLHFRPNIFSTPNPIPSHPIIPKQLKSSSSFPHWNGSSSSALQGDTNGVIHYPRIHLLSHPPLPPSAAAKSMELFYRNPEGGQGHESSSEHYGVRSSSTLSSVSSNNIAVLEKSSSNSIGNGRFPLTMTHSEPRNFNGQSSSSRGLKRVSESSTDFLHQRLPAGHQHNPYYHRNLHQQYSNGSNVFNPDEIRSHRHLYENRLSSGGDPMMMVKAEKGQVSGSSGSGSGSSISLGLARKVSSDTWNYLGHGQSNNGIIAESPEYSDYSHSHSQHQHHHPLNFQNYHHHHHHNNHIRSGSGTTDSLDFCSCGDSNSKYSIGTGAPLSSLSEFSSFGGSTTTDTSDFIPTRGGGVRLSANNDYQYHHHQQQHSH